MHKDAIKDKEEGSDPLVSVLVPSYNHEKYVVECLESIRNLNYERLELIVSDDCSSDSTFALTEQWVRQNADRFERTLVVKQERNVGIVENLQFLFNNAQGAYLAYIASDDVFVDSSVTDRLRVLQEDETIDAVLGNSQLISDSGELLQERRISNALAEKLTVCGLLTAALLKHWGSPGPSLLLRRKAILENGSIGTLPRGLHFEDRYIFIRLAALGKLRYVDLIVMKYRKSKTSMQLTPEFSRVKGSCVIASDYYNRKLIVGIERLYLDAVGARIRNKMKSGHRAILYFRDQYLAVIILLLWKILVFRALLSKLTDRASLCC